MSNFRQLTIHPRTGNVETADWLDDHYGRHLYGVKFADGLIVPETDIEPLWPPFNDGKRFQYRTYNNGLWQVYGNGLRHVCECEFRWQAEMVCEALNRS